MQYYKFYLDHRPAQIGAVHMDDRFGFVDEADGGARHGAIYYTAPLDPSEVYDYELRPASFSEYNAAEFGISFSAFAITEKEVSGKTWPAARLDNAITDRRLDVLKDMARRRKGTLMGDAFVFVRQEDRDWFADVATGYLFATAKAD